MFKIDETFRNPKQVNQAGGILIQDSTGAEYYLDSDHPQHAEVLAGDFGRVEEALIEPGPVDDSLDDHHQLKELKKLVAELLDASTVNTEKPEVKSAMDKLKIGRSAESG